MTLMKMTDSEPLLLWVGVPAHHLISHVRFCCGPESRVRVLWSPGVVEKPLSSSDLPPSFSLVAGHSLVVLSPLTSPLLLLS